MRNELSECDGIVWRGERFAIPTFRPEIRSRIHYTHMGRKSVLRRVRQVVYWPGMTSELTDILPRCNVCMSHASQQLKQPISQHTPPTRVWQKIFVDISHFAG